MLNVSVDILALAVGRHGSAEKARRVGVAWSTQTPAHHRSGRVIGPPGSKYQQFYWNVLRRSRENIQRFKLWCAETYGRRKINGLPEIYNG